MFAVYLYESLTKIPTPLTGSVWLCNSHMLVPDRSNGVTCFAAMSQNGIALRRVRHEGILVGSQFSFVDLTRDALTCLLGFIWFHQTLHRAHACLVSRLIGHRSCDTGAIQAEHVQTDAFGEYRLAVGVRTHLCVCLLRVLWMDFLCVTRPAPSQISAPFFPLGLRMDDCFVLFMFNLYGIPAKQHNQAQNTDTPSITSPVHSSSKLSLQHNSDNS